MAEAAAKLAETLVNGTADDAAPASCRYLFHQRAAAPAGHAVATHHHSYWQYEHIYRGEVAIIVAGRRFMLRDGGAMLIPPGLEHRLEYRAADNAWRSVKFAMTGGSDAAAGGATTLAEDEIIAGIHRALDGCLTGAFEPPPEARTVAGTLLSALLAHVCTAVEPAAAALDPVVAQVQHWCRRSGGQPLSVQGLAKQVGLSPGRLSARFREATGEPVKRYIDRSRAAEAARLLAFSDRSVSGVAEILRFSDPFTFSRFFRHHVGESPRAFRNRIGELRVRRADAIRRSTDLRGR